MGDLISETNESGVKIGTKELSTKLKGDSVVVTEDSSASVVFTTAFNDVPNVVVTPISNDSDHKATAFNVTVNGFDVYMNKSGGGPAGDITVHWIATDAGNP